MQRPMWSGVHGVSSVGLSYISHILPHTVKYYMCLHAADGSLHSTTVITGLSQNMVPSYEQ